MWPFIIPDADQSFICADILKQYGVLVDFKNKKIIDTSTELSIVLDLFMETSIIFHLLIEINHLQNS